MKIYVKEIERHRLEIIMNLDEKDEKKQFLDKKNARFRFTISLKFMELNSPFKISSHLNKCHNISHN